MIIDSNIGIGRLANGLGAGIATPEALINVMDKNGIAYALVYDTLAMESDPQAGNEKLMRVIDGNPRLFATWVLIPNEEDTAQTIRNMCENNVVAARLFPQRGHYSIRPWCIGELAGKLQVEKRILMIDFEDNGWSENAVDWEGIYDLCRNFSQLPVILLGVTVTAPRNYHKIIRDCPNLYLEISRLSAPCSMMRMAKSELTKQIVFGSGWPHSSPEGILTMLDFEDIETDDLKMITGGNLRRLLNLRHDGHDDMNYPRKKIPSDKIIDMHVHHGGWHPASSDSGKFEDTISQMNRCGITTAVVTSLWSCYGEVAAGNEAVATACDNYPGRFFGYITVDPKYPEEIKEQMEKHGDNPHFKGFKFHCETHGVDICHPGYERALEHANAKRWPVLVHEQIPPIPDAWPPLCLKYPEVKFIVAHMGLGSVCDKTYIQLARLCREYKNLYLDTAASKICPGFLESLIKEAGSENIVYGSDYPLFDFAYQLGRVMSAAISTKDKENILYNNARKLLFE